MARSSVESRSLLNRIYDKITTGAAKEGGAKAAIFKQAYAAKQYWLKYNYVKHSVWDPLVFDKVCVCVRVCVPWPQPPAPLCRSRRRLAWTAVTLLSQARLPSLSTSWSSCASCSGTRSLSIKIFSKYQIHSHSMVRSSQYIMDLSRIRLYTLTRCVSHSVRCVCVCVCACWCVSPFSHHAMFPCARCPVLEGYGQTECYGAASITSVSDFASVGHVGGPIACNEIKLVSVPEVRHDCDSISAWRSVCMWGFAPGQQEV